MQPNYSCCTFRGSLAALDLKTGQKQWQTYMITEPLQPTRKNANGIQMQGPAGAPVWASPTVDAKRGLVYVVTGDSYTDATTDGDDAIVAVEMKTGKVRWRNQVTTNDNFIVGCSGPVKAANCPSPTGPDFDFGATPILFKHGNKQILVAGQKSGIVYGVDPDTGRTLWKTAVGAGSPLGGIEWGIGADSKYVFVPNSDIGEIFNEIAVAAGAPSPAPENAAAGQAGVVRAGSLHRQSRLEHAGSESAVPLRGRPLERLYEGRLRARSIRGAGRHAGHRFLGNAWMAGFAPTMRLPEKSFGNSAPRRKPTTPSTATRLSPAAESTAWDPPSRAAWCTPCPDSMARPEPAATASMFSWRFRSTENKRRAARAERYSRQTTSLAECVRQLMGITKDRA